MFPTLKLSFENIITYN